MGVTIHQLRGIVTSDVRGFLQGMGQVKQSTADLRKQWIDTANSIATAATRITGAIAGIGVYAVKQFAEFEDVMIEVGAISRTLGTKDFKLLEQAALDMGEATRYTATQAAGALKELSLSGLDASQSIAALPATLQLATAAGISIGQAAGIAAKTMKAFGMEASQLSHVNDVLVSTFTRSNTTLDQLAEGMKHVAPLANVLGVSIEEMSAVLGKMADAGFQGEMGGTALRQILSKLSGAMPEAIGKLSRLGITTLDSTGKMRPMLDVLQEIEQAGLSAGEVMEIFGQRGGPQLLALLEQGIDGVRKFAKESENAGGLSERMMKARMQSFKGQWDELTSQIDSLFIDLGGSVAPILTDLVNETEAWIKANKEDIIKGMGEVVRSLINTLRDLLKWVSENKRELWAWAGAIAGAIKWIAEFLATRPYLLAFFAMWKVAGILGVTSAIANLGGALASTIGWLGRATQAWMAYRAAAAAGSAAGAIGGAGAAGMGAAARWAASGKYAGLAAGLAGNVGGGAATTAATGALAVLAAKASIVALAIGVVATKLGLLEKALVSAAEATGKRAIDKQRAANIALISDEQDRQIAEIRNARAEETERTGKDPGVKSTVRALANQRDADFSLLPALKQKWAEQSQASDAASANVALAHKGSGADLQAAKEKADNAAHALAITQGKIDAILNGSKKLTKAIGDEVTITFNTIRDQVKDKGVRESFTRQMQELNARFLTGKDTAEQFADKVDALTERMKKVDDDSSGSDAFQALKKTKRRMQEGELPDGTKLANGASSGVDFTNLETLQAALQNLSNVDKQWADLIALRTNAELEFVEKMRADFGNTKEVLAAEAALSDRIKELETEAREATSATIADQLTRTQKEQKLTRRKEAADGYEGFSEQITEMINTAGGATEGGLKNIGADAINQLAEGVEGATKDQKDKFVQDFKDLQAKGPQAFLEGIEELTLAFVEGANESKKAAEKIEENRKELEAALKEMDSPGGFTNRVEELRKQDPTNPGYAELERLKQLARDNKIDAGEFDRKTGRVMTGLEAGASAREGAAGMQTSVAEQAAKAGEQFSQGFSSQLQKFVNGQMADAVAKFNAGLAALQREFLDTDMSTDEFNRRLGELKKGLDNVGNAALEAAMKAQRAAIMRGDFSSLDLRKALEERLMSFRMGQWNQWVDYLFNQMMGLGNATANLQQGFNEFGNGINRLAAGGTAWLENTLGGGGGGDISGGLAVLNSPSGKIATLNNQIAELAQVLQLTNVRESRKEEIRKQIGALQDQIANLQNGPAPIFSGTSSDPFFRDPGLHLVGNQAGGGGQPGGRGGQSRGQVNTTVNFPNVNKFTSADAALIFDALEREAQKRGKRLYGVS